jgi:hypothetical protein
LQIIFKNLNVYYFTYFDSIIYLIFTGRSMGYLDKPKPQDYFMSINFLSNTKTLHPAKWILTLTAVQVLCGTYFLKINGFHAINSILFFITCIGISICLLIVPLNSKSMSIVQYKQLPGKFLVLAVLTAISYFLCRKIMDATPVRIENADMLPIIKVMGQRFLDGEIHKVYSPVNEIWGGIQPIYLPALWLPFTASILFHFDPRWVTVTGIWLCVLLIVLPVAWKIKRWEIVVLGLTVMLLLYWLHFEETNNVIRLTEEGVVFFYYSLMVYAIVSGRAWMIGAVAALCLLSRYALIGWLPCIALYWLINKEYKKLFHALLAGGILISGLLIFPFGTSVIKMLLAVPGQYIAHAQTVWERNPEYFSQSLGLAKFFGKAHVGELHTTLLITVFVLPVIFLLVWKMMKTGFELNQTNFLLASFYFSISIFYNLLDVSYLYLYYTILFVSLVTTALALRSMDFEENVK